MTSSQRQGLHSSVGWSVAPVLGGHGFEPHWSPEFFRLPNTIARIAFITLKIIAYFEKGFFSLGIGISLQCECRSGGFYPSHSVLIKQLGSVQCITLLQKQQHFQIIIIMLQWHFSCLFFVGFAYSSDFKLLRSSWRNTTASCADLLQHLPSQSQPYQPDNGKSYSEPDD